MENKQIGDYLKRLRQHAGYTQAEVGQFLSVTYKAISRWESGTGTPELGNLLMLSKLYRITVDDILNCNEDVFARIESKMPSESCQATPNGSDQAILSAVQANGQNSQTKKKSYVLDKPAERYNIVLYFAYFALGVFVLSWHGADAAVVSTSYILYIQLIIAGAVISLLGNIIPKKARAIVSISLSSALLLNTLILMILQFTCFSYTVGYNPYNTYNYESYPLGTVLFLFLLAISIIYNISEFYEKKKTKKLMAWIAFGVAALAMIYAAIAAYVINNIISTGFEEIIIGVVLSAAVALGFTAAQVFSKWLLIFPAVFVVPFICVTIGTSILLKETIISVHLEVSGEIWTAIASSAIVFMIAAFLLEGNRIELIATRVAIVMSIALCFPSLINTLDYIGVNILAQAPADFILALFIRLAIMTAGIICFIRPFNFRQIPEYIKNRRNNNEE